MSGYARAAVAAAVSAMVLTAVACGTSTQHQAGSPTRPATSSPAASEAATAPASTASAATCDHTAWRHAPFTGRAAGTTAAGPVVTAIRTAQHPDCRYDRLVIDIAGRPVAYSVRYVARVVTDASGQPIALPGADYLVITLRPAQAHRDSGRSTVPRRVQVTSYPELRAWAVSGDFEGVVSVALGLRDHPAVRVGSVANHIYLDVAE